MHEFVEALRRLAPHSRLTWVRPRAERTVVFESAGEVAEALPALAERAREVEVYRPADGRYVVYVRE